MISGTTTDYTGRQTDILILRGANVNTANAVQTTIEFGSPSSMCAGVQKLMQRYAISMLTILGSQQNFASFGTTLMSSLQNAGGQTTSDLNHLFNYANLTVVTNFRNYQANNPSNFPDEQLNTATLNSVDISGNSVRLNISIVSVAGTTVQFLLPIPSQ